MIGKFKLLFHTVFYLFDQRKNTYSVFCSEKAKFVTLFFLKFRICST